jgi:hypothetical protein
MELTQRSQHPRPLAFGPSQAGQHRAAGAAVGEALADGGRQHGMRADLDERVEPVLDELVHGGGEQHWLANIPPPVRRVQQPALNG